MKKSSIILCSFAVLLIIAGIILCFVGKGMGDVFDNTVITEGDYIKRTEITETVKTISVKFTDVTVNVYGGADSSYIETVNIEDDQISAKSAAEITVADKTDYLSMVYETVTEFSGLRNIIFPGKSYTGDKTVNIYLSGEYNITQLNFQIDNGAINIADMDSNTDYGLEIMGEGDITMNNVITRSNINLRTGMGKVSLAGVDCELLSGSIETGNLHCREENPGEHHYDLTCENGMIYLLEESQGNTYQKNDGEDPSKIEFKITNGNIHLLKNEQPITE